MLITGKSKDNKAGLTDIQRRFAAAYVSTGGDRKASVAQSGSLSKSPINAARAMLKIPAVRKQIDKLCRQVGLTPDKVLGTIARNLTAQRTIQLRNRPAGEDLYKEDDAQSQLRAAELGLRVHGIGQESASGPSVAIGINTLSNDQWRELCDSWQPPERRPPILAESEPS